MFPGAILENACIRLTPLKSGQWNLLVDLIDTPGLWDSFPYQLNTSEKFKEWMEERVDYAAQGKWLPYLIHHKKLNRAVGLTCFLNIDQLNHNVEIGGTWYGAAFQGSDVNPNCKYLMLQQAFDVLGFERVEFKTDSRNLRSRKAISKLGAREEGTLRSQRIVQNGYRRDTVYFSILKSEWPAIKSNLAQRISSLS